VLADVLADAARGHESGESLNRDRRDAQDRLQSVPTDQPKATYCT